MSENKEFIVSARKYRPQTFRSVIGQRHITETLRNAIANRQLAHAYLFTGPRGVGKTTCARIFARSINCLNPSPEFEACGVCESCVSFAADRSFNIHEMDAASNNSVDDIRALTDKVRVAPQVGKYSVYIIDEVHMLSTAAFNAFLKTLEEPPAHAIFVLATTEKHKILPTILSRCQTFDFKRIRVEDMVEYLRYIASQENIAVDDESLHLIAQKADGGMRDALSTFDRVVSFCGDKLEISSVAECVGALDFMVYFSAVDMARTGDYAGLLMLFDNVLTRGFDPQYFLSGFAGHFRNLLVAKNPQTLPLLEASGSVSARYAQSAAECDTAFLFGGVNLLSIADATYRTATSRRLHVELTLMKLAGLAPSVDPSIKPVRAVLPKVDGAPSVAAPVATSTPVAQPVPQPQPAPQPVAQPTPAPIPAPALVAQSAPQPQAAPQPAPAAQQKSVLGFSINAAAAAQPQTTPQAAQTAPAVQLTPEQVQATLQQRFGELIALWESRNRPRTTMVLSTAVVGLNSVKVSVPNELMEEEITNCRVEIEGDMMRLFSCRLPIEIELNAEIVVERPVTVQQRLEHLVEKNPNILKLKDSLDLTV